MRGLREGARERGLLFAVGVGGRRPVEGDIAGRLRPELRRVRLYCVARVGDGGELVVFDRDEIGGVLRLRISLGQHQRHRLADMHDAVVRERRPVRRDRRLAAAAGDRMGVGDRVIMLRGADRRR